MKKFTVLIGLVVFILSLSYCPAEVFSAEIIVDNGGTGTLPTGTWYNSSGSGYYGSVSVYTRAAANRYTFEADVNGSSDVYIRWTYHESRCSNVAVDIYDGAVRIDTVYVNQLQDGGQWNKKGTYTFNGTASVVIRGDGDCSSTSFSVNADAVKFDIDDGPGASEECPCFNLDELNAILTDGFEEVQCNSESPFSWLVIDGNTVGDAWWMCDELFCGGTCATTLHGGVSMDITVEQAWSCRRDMIASYLWNICQDQK